MSTDLDAMMDFDHVVQVHADGTVTDGPEGTYAPDLHEGNLESDDWTLLDGYSGQYGYAGPLMHQSEYVGGGMARDILARPGLYVTLVNTPSEEEEATEWAVAYREV